MRYGKILTIFLIINFLCSSLSPDYAFALRPSAAAKTGMANRFLASLRHLKSLLSSTRASQETKRSKSATITRRQAIKAITAGTATVLFSSPDVLLAQDKETGKIMLFFASHAQKEDFERLEKKLSLSIDALLKDGRDIHFFVEGPCLFRFQRNLALYKALDPKSKHDLTDIFGSDLYVGPIPEKAMHAKLDRGMEIEAMIVSEESLFTDKLWPKAKLFVNNLNSIEEKYNQIVQAAMESSPGAIETLKRIELVFAEYMDDLDNSYNEGTDTKVLIAHRLALLRGGMKFFLAQHLFLTGEKYGRHLGNKIFVHHERMTNPLEWAELEEMSEIPDNFLKADFHVGIFEQGFKKEYYLPAVFFLKEKKSKLPVDERMTLALDHIFKVLRRSFVAVVKKRDRNMNSIIGSHVQEPSDVAVVTRGSWHEVTLSRLASNSFGKDRVKVQKISMSSYQSQKAQSGKDGLSEEEQHALYFRESSPRKEELQFCMRMISYKLIRFLFDQVLAATTGVVPSNDTDSKYRCIDNLVSKEKEKVESCLHDIYVSLKGKPELSEMFLKEVLWIYDIYCDVYRAENDIKNNKFKLGNHNDDGMLSAIYLAAIKHNLLSKKELRFIHDAIEKLEKEGGPLFDGWSTKQRKSFYKKFKKEISRKKRPDTLAPTVGISAGIAGSAFSTRSVSRKIDSSA